MEVFEIESEKPKVETTKKLNSKFVVFLSLLFFMWLIIFYLLYSIFVNISEDAKKKEEFYSKQKVIADTEGKIKELLKERNEAYDKEASLIEKLNTLQKQKSTIIQDIEDFKTKNKDLRNEIDSFSLI